MLGRFPARILFFSVYMDVRQGEGLVLWRALQGFAALCIVAQRFAELRRKGLEDIQKEARRGEELEKRWMLGR